MTRHDLRIKDGGKIKLDIENNMLVVKN